MRDPHVVALHGCVDFGPSLLLHAAQPREYKTTTFSLGIADGRLRVELVDDPATAADTVGEIERYLQSWEILTNLRYGSGALKWRILSVEVVDGPPGAEVSAVVRRFLAPRGRPTLSVRNKYTLAQYPDLPDRFLASPIVVSLWQRYNDYLNHRERLTQVAWWCITTIEWSAGGRTQAARRYSLSDHVLKELRRLANVGDEWTARKRFDGQDLRAHTGAEAAWMEVVVKRIIERVGEWAFDPTAQWPQITMADFPKL